MSEITQPIPARLKNVAVNGHVAGAADIFDDSLNKTQAVINAEINEVLGEGGNVAFIDDDDPGQAVVPSFDPESQSVHVTSQVLSEQQKAQVRTNIGLNDVDTRISNAVNGVESEMNTKFQQYDTAIGALNGSDVVVGALPQSGETNKVYRVPNDPTTNKYTDYGWDGTQFVALATYPNDVDDVPTVGSENLVKSGGVAENATLPLMNIGNFGYVTKNKGWTTKGYYNCTTGEWVNDNTRRTSDLIDVYSGARLKVSGDISSSLTALVVGFDKQGNYGNWYYGRGTGTLVRYEDEMVTIPQGVYKIAIETNNYLITEFEYKQWEFIPDVYKKAETYPKESVYTKQEVDNKIGQDVVYGVRWNVSNNDDLGERCLGAVGLTATIGIGNTDGHSDFDTIYPWSEMKRCNINVNTNGAKIVTFEGESGFALDGSNGDVFVRIPKFKVEKYIKDGYEYRTIGSPNGIIHPAFIENGKELDEIFVSAFEGYSDGNVLKSIGNVIPTSNLTLSEFLALATNKGIGNTLYDNRAIDAIWTLFAVEYGCRNTNHILGYGLSDFEQPVAGNAIIASASNTNTVRVGYRAGLYNYMSVSQNITICQNGSQLDILAQRKIVSVVKDSGNTYIDVTFDGAPISVDTNCFIGSAAFNTNFCETCGSAKKLNWHTGRAEYVTNSTTQNPIRYRWIENVVGNLWHSLPDITFNGLQMYICDNIKDYEACSITAPYRPVGSILPENINNGNKGDIVDANYWITSLQDDIFAKGISFGKSYNKSLLSTQAFGAYYYLASGLVTIVNGGGFDHLYRCNMLTQRAWTRPSDKWYLYGARIIYKNIE